MHTYHRFPHPLLRACIDRYWGWECEPSERVTLPRVLPGTGVELFLHHGTPFQHAAAEGTRCLPRHHTLCVRRRALPLAPVVGAGFVAVRFRAGRLARLTALPVAECLDQPLPIEALWGTPGRDLAERVAAAADFPQRVELIERFLLQQLDRRRDDPLVTAAVDRLYRASSELTIAQLAGQLGIGRRQLERRFLAAEGLTPAAFRGRVRFQKTVRQLMLEPSRPLLETALAHGYYDQSHFCRDFRRLAGRSPAGHLAQAQRATHFYNPSRR